MEIQKKNSKQVDKGLWPKIRQTGGVIQNQKIKSKGEESQDECCRANNDTFLGSQQARLEGQNLNLNNSALFINYT